MEEPLCSGELCGVEARRDSRCQEVGGGEAEMTGLSLWLPSCGVMGGGSHAHPGQGSPSLHLAGVELVLWLRRSAHVH